MSLFPGYGDSDEENGESQEIEENMQKIFGGAISSSEETGGASEKKGRKKNSNSSEPSSDTSSSERYRKRRRRKEERRLRRKLKKEKRREEKRKHYFHSSDEEREERKKARRKDRSPVGDKESSRRDKSSLRLENVEKEKVNSGNKIFSSIGSRELNTGINKNNLNTSQKSTPIQFVKQQTKESLLKEREAYEIKLKSERDLLKNILNSNPNDLAIWLRFIELQDEESKFRKHSVVVANDLKLAIIENGLKSIGGKCVELKIEKLKCLANMEDFNIAIKQWGVYLIQHPNSLILWEHIINTVLFHFSDFTVPFCLRVMGDCYRTLAKFLRGEIITHRPEPETEMFLGSLLVRLIKLHFHFGYSEIAIDMITCFIEFNFCKPNHLDGTQHNRLIEHFNEFLACGCSKAGFEGALGWCTCYEKHFTRFSPNSWMNCRNDDSNENSRTTTTSENRSRSSVSNEENCQERDSQDQYSKGKQNSETSVDLKGGMLNKKNGDGRTVSFSRNNLPNQQNTRNPQQQHPVNLEIIPQNRGNMAIVNSRYQEIQQSQISYINSSQNKMEISNTVEISKSTYSLSSRVQQQQQPSFHQPSNHLPQMSDNPNYQLQMNEPPIHSSQIPGNLPFQQQMVVPSGRPPQMTGSPNYQSQMSESPINLSQMQGDLPFQQQMVAPSSRPQQMVSNPNYQSQNNEPSIHPSQMQGNLPFQQQMVVAPNRPQQMVGSPNYQSQNNEPTIHPSQMPANPNYQRQTGNNQGFQQQKNVPSMHQQQMIGGPRNQSQMPGNPNYQNQMKVIPNQRPPVCQRQPSEFPNNPQQIPGNTYFKQTQGRFQNHPPQMQGNANYSKRMPGPPYNVQEMPNGHELQQQMNQPSNRQMEMSGGMNHPSQMGGDINIYELLRRQSNQQSQTIDGSNFPPQMSRNPIHPSQIPNIENFQQQYNEPPCQPQMSGNPNFHPGMIINQNYQSQRSNSPDYKQQIMDPQIISQQQFIGSSNFSPQMVNVLNYQQQMGGNSNIPQMIPNPPQPYIHQSTVPPMQRPLNSNSHPSDGRPNSGNLTNPNFNMAKSYGERITVPEDKCIPPPLTAKEICSNPTAKNTNQDNVSQQQQTESNQKTLPPSDNKVESDSKTESDKYPMPPPNPYASLRPDSTPVGEKIDYRRTLLPKEELPVSPASEVILPDNEQLDNIEPENMELVYDVKLDKNNELEEETEDVLLNSEFIKEEDAYCLLAKKEGHPLSKIWLMIEQIREKYNYYPLEPSEYDNKDKDRNVNFNKSVSYTLFTFSNNVKEYILLEILKLFRVNIDKVSGIPREPDINSLYDLINVRSIDTHPPYEALDFIERLLKFLGERQNETKELEKISFGIYKAIVRYGKNLKCDNKGNEKFAKKLKENFINITTLEDKKEKCIKLISYFDELFYDSQFMNSIDLALDEVDVKVLAKIYQPAVSEREKLILKKAMFNYSRRFFMKRDLVSDIAFFLMTDSIDITGGKIDNFIHYKTMAGERLFTLHDDEKVKHEFFLDWKLDDLKYISGLVMILKYQMFSDTSFPLSIIKFLEGRYPHERLEMMEELFLLQEEIYADYYEKKNKVYDHVYDKFVVETIKKYPKFVNLLMVYLRRSSVHNSIHIESSFLESLEISKLPKMMAIIYNEILLFQKDFNKCLERNCPCFSFNKLRQVIFKYADQITRMTLSPVVWKLLLQLEYKYGTKESLKNSFLKGLESVGWSKDYYMEYLSYDSTAFDNVFQLFIEKGIRTRCLKEELPILLK